MHIFFYVEDAKGGLKKSELVAWYLDQIQDQIDSEEELLERKNFIEKIIDRLTYHVCIKIVNLKLFEFYFFWYFNSQFFFSFLLNCILGSNYNTSNYDRSKRQRRRRRR